ncbi:MAG: hypothetical protein ABR609_13540 [Acidimicrobiia bacterium]
MRIVLDSAVLIDVLWGDLQRSHRKPLGLSEMVPDPVTEHWPVGV